MADKLALHARMAHEFWTQHRTFSETKQLYDSAVIRSAFIFLHACESRNTAFNRVWSYDGGYSFLALGPRPGLSTRGPAKAVQRKILGKIKRADTNQYMGRKEGRPALV